MQTYNELLSEFHHGQESVLQEDSHVHYLQLLNQLKLNKDKQLQTKKKFKFESSRLKTLNNDSPKHSILQKSLQFSKFTQTNDTYKQKRSLIELQGESLQKEINHTTSGFQKLKVQKHLIQEELEIINKKQIQIQIALCELQNNLEELKALIKQQKQTNEKDFLIYGKKISQLTEKLSNINEENLLNSKYYQHLNTTKTQTKNKSLLGTILMWQSEQSKLKKLPKKIYTKTQIESMLRALFLINKMSQLNYGNIIEHLIKISEPKKLGKTQTKLEERIFLNQKGEEISVNELVTHLQKQLLTPNECKFLSKIKIVEFYARKGIVIESEWQPNNLSQVTLHLINKVVAHFQNLTSWFSRIQKRNLQLSQNYRSLLKIQEKLEKQVRSIQSSAVENSINYLQSRQQQIEHLYQKLNSVCKVIFLFNINIHDLIRRFQNLNKFFDKIVKSTNRHTYKKTFVQYFQNTDFLKRINKSLFKSPQCIIMDWNNVIKRVKTETAFMTTAEMFEQIPQNEMYFETVMKNDLLRIYAEPSMFDKDKSYIENLKITFDYVINEEADIVGKLCSILNDLLLFSKNGIKEYDGYRIMRKEEKKKVVVKDEEDKETSAKLDPLIRLLQQSNVKLDKFFAKDQIKQDAEQTPETEAFCVQSNEFYRRDNFKLIQKLQKLQLKRRGLLPSVPFAVNTSLQLQPLARTVEDISFDRDTSRFGSTRNSYRKKEPRMSHQMFSTRHNIVSERREFENSRKKDLKDLLSNISNIASDNQKYRIRKKLNCQEEMRSTSTSRVWVNRGQLESVTKREKNE